jgi:hypothetical protein
MDIPVVAGVAAVVLLALVRHFAARRVAARQGRFVSLMFVPTLVGSVAILWGSIQVFASAPIVGMLMAIGGLLYVAIVVIFLSRLSRSVTSAGPQDDIATAISEPLMDYMVTMAGVLLIGGLLVLIGLISWGVTEAAG